MGFYIELPFQQMGDNFNKADQLISYYGAEPTDQPSNIESILGDKVLICVVNNSMFEAAGICYDDHGLAVFTDPTDPRDKQWLLLDRSKAIELCPKAAAVLT